MTFLSLLSSFVPTAHCDDQAPTPEEDAPKDAGAPEEEEGKGEGEDKGEEPAEEEEPEEEEPEDIMPGIREECANSKNCAPARREFEHCEKKVHGGAARPHEDCVEELFHMMHCVDNCSAPKLFAKLR